MKLLVVIVCYRVPELTIDCLHSLSSRIQEVPGSRVVVCENASGGNAVQLIQNAIDSNNWHHWAHLVPSNTNLGFTGGNNLVIRQALQSPNPPQYVHLLNPDTTVHDNALKSLVDFMDQNPKAGIAGSQLLNPDGSLSSSSFRFFSISSEFLRGARIGLVSKLLPHANVTSPLADSPTQTDWVPGASMILRQTLLDQIGLLDEGLFTYFDDIDICLRAHRAGWQTWYVPQSLITHITGMSTGISQNQPQKRRPAYWFQARRRFFLKNHGPLYTTLADAAFLSGYASWRLRRSLQRKPDNDPPLFLKDSFQQSVFRTGFQLNTVENPSLTPHPKKQEALQGPTAQNAPQSQSLPQP